MRVTSRVEPPINKRPCCLHFPTHVQNTGVVKVKGQWLARLCARGQRQEMGPFESEEAAAKAYDEEATKLWENPTLNFLPDGFLNPNRHVRAPWAFRPRDTGPAHGDDDDGDGGAAAAAEGGSGPSSSSSSNFKGVSARGHTVTAHHVCNRF